ncbi:MAG: Wzz/FepE/Etk N-terminal domain-containing protein [Dehalococcoidia bacterium]
MNEESRLQIDRYLQLANRRKWVLVIPIVLAVAGAALLSYVTDPVYTASATARVDVGLQGGTLQDSNSEERYINTYAVILRSKPFLDRVIEDLNLDITTRKLSKRIGAAPVAGTELIKVTAKAPSAAEAAAIANDLTGLLRDPAVVGAYLADTTAALTRQIETTRQTLEDEQARLGNLSATGASAAQIASQQSIVEATQATYENLLLQREEAQLRQAQAIQGFTVVEPAEEPTSPTSPRWTFNLAAGLLGGLAAGVALALALEYVDPTVRGVRDLEAITPLPVLASIPFGVRWKYPPPPVSPDYRLLATKLRTAVLDQHRKSLLFTSSRPEEGNTTVATYAAMAMAQAGLRVLLVDANLNRPDLHRLFNLPLAPGLYNFISTNGLRAMKPMEEAAAAAIQASPVPRLSVLTAGNKMNDPSEVLASVEMREILEHLKREWDAVVIDGASMATSAGSAVLASVVDAVVLVAAEGQASSRSVEETVAELNSLGGHPLGLVYCKASEA